MRRAVPARGIPALLLALAAGSAAHAGPASVLAASARCTPDSICSFRVTVKHADTGWDHYADRFEVLSPSGEILGTRVLRHPHVGEQPFTRSLEGVRVPAELKEVRVRAHDSVHGYGGDEVRVALQR